MKLKEQYMINLIESHLHIFINALDLFSRIGMYQLCEIEAVRRMRNPAYREQNLKNREDIKRCCDSIKAIITDLPPNGYNSIRDPTFQKVSDCFQIAWDIQQVIQCRVANDNIEKYSHSVWRYPPMKCGSLPFIKCTKHDDGEKPFVFYRIFLDYHHLMVLINSLDVFWSVGIGHFNPIVRVLKIENPQYHYKFVANLEEIEGLFKYLRFLIMGKEECDSINDETYEKVSECFQIAYVMSEILKSKCCQLTKVFSGNPSKSIGSLPDFDIERVGEIQIDERKENGSVVAD